MKTKSSRSQNPQNVTITINTLRERAGEMLNVANHLEATERFLGNGTSNVIRGSGKRQMSLTTRRKIAKANKARAAQKRKELAVVGKAA